jgi:hypothetical protein
LQQAGDHDAPGRCIGRAWKQERDGQRRDQAEIEQDGRCCGGREFVDRVEIGREQRHQRDEEQIGKGDPRQRNRELETLRVVGEAGREHAHDLGHEGQGQGQQRDLNDQVQAEDAVGEERRGGLARLLPDARVGRDIGLIEGALAEDGPEMVGQAQRHRKRIHHRPGAKHGCKHDVAHEARHAREQRETTDGEDFSEHCLPWVVRNLSPHPANLA